MNNEPTNQEKNTFVIIGGTPRNGKALAMQLRKREQHGTHCWPTYRCRYH